jgi:hypothetical protein
MPITLNVEFGVNVVIHHPDLVNPYSGSIGDETRTGTLEITQGQNTMLPLYHQLMEEDQRSVK